MSGFQLARNYAQTEYPAPLETFIITGDGSNPALAIGDVVQIEPAVPSATGIMACKRAVLTANGQTMLGIVMGNSIDPDNEIVGIPLNFSGTREILVNTNTQAVYEVEVDFGTAEVVIADIGNTIALVPGTSVVGSISTSGMKVDGNAKASGANSQDHPFLILAISEFQSGSTVNALKVLVTPNATLFNAGQEGA